MEFSFTLDNFQIDKSLLEQLMGKEEPQIFSITATECIETLVQKRKHKKKRINKKWAKRYGFDRIVNPVRFNLPECYFEENKDDSNYVFTALNNK